MGVAVELWPPQKDIFYESLSFKCILLPAEDEMQSSIVQEMIDTFGEEAVNLPSGVYHKSPIRALPDLSQEPWRHGARVLDRRRATAAPEEFISGKVGVSGTLEKGDVTKSMPLILKAKGKEDEKIEEEEDRKHLMDFMAVDFKRAMREVSAVVRTPDMWTPLYSATVNNTTHP